MYEDCQNEMHLDLLILIHYYTCEHQLTSRKHCSACNFLAIWPWLFKQHHLSYNPHEPHKVTLKGCVFFPVFMFQKEINFLAWPSSAGIHWMAPQDAVTLMRLQLLYVLQEYSYPSYGKGCLETAVSGWTVHLPEIWTTFHRGYQSGLLAYPVLGSIGEIPRYSLHFQHRSAAWSPRGCRWRHGQGGSGGCSVPKLHNWKREVLFSLVAQSFVVFDTKCPEKSLYVTKGFLKIVSYLFIIIYTLW